MKILGQICRKTVHFKEDHSDLAYPCLSVWRICSQEGGKCPSVDVLSRLGSTLAHAPQSLNSLQGSYPSKHTVTHFMINFLDTFKEIGQPDKGQGIRITEYGFHMFTSTWDFVVVCDWFP